MLAAASILVGCALCTDALHWQPVLACQLNLLKALQGAHLLIDCVWAYRYKNVHAMLSRHGAAGGGGSVRCSSYCCIHHSAHRGYGNKYVSYLCGLLGGLRLQPWMLC
jgi:hypothetical protein